jgi:hypothetical protein
MKRRTFLRKTVTGIGALASLQAGRQRMEAASLEPSSGGETESVETRSALSRHGRGQYRRIKEYLDLVPLVDMHEHLRAFD